MRFRKKESKGLVARPADGRLLEEDIKDGEYGTSHAPPGQPNGAVVGVVVDGEAGGARWRRWQSAGGRRLRQRQSSGGRR